jgi:hypothetical protein
MFRLNFIIFFFFDSPTYIKCHEYERKQLLYIRVHNKCKDTVNVYWLLIFVLDHYKSLKSPELIVRSSIFFFSTADWVIDFTGEDLNDKLSIFFIELFYHFVVIDLAQERLVYKIYWFLLSGCRVKDLLCRQEIPDSICFHKFYFFKYLY